MTTTKILRTVSTATVLLLASASLAGVARAQGAQGGPPAGIPRNQEEFEKQMGITDAQKAKLKALAAKYAPRYKAIQDKWKPSFEPIQKQQEALQKQLIELQKKFAAEINPIRMQQQKENDAILTPVQRQKIAALRAQVQQMQAQQQAAQQGGGAPRR